MRRTVAARRVGGGVGVTVYVCHCEAVSDRAVEAALASGARSVDEVTDRCRAGGGCGSCHELLQALIDATAACAEPVAVSSAA